MVLTKAIHLSRGATLWLYEQQNTYTSDLRFTCAPGACWCGVQHMRMCVAVITQRQWELEPPISRYARCKQTVNTGGTADVAKDRGSAETSTLACRRR